MSTPEAETTRATSLRTAESQAITFFTSIQDLIRPGITETALSKEIHALGASNHNVRTHWHKRLIRSGPNTLRPFADNPPDRTLQPDDILVIDLGPVFADWEADFGRTYVLGDDPAKTRLRDSLMPVWMTVRDRYRQRADDITGAELYAIAREEVEKVGYAFGSHIAGHVVGDFPHERIPDDKISLYITEGNHRPLNSVGKDGMRRHWILEIHAHDLDGGFGGFCEQLLTVD